MRLEAVPGHERCDVRLAQSEALLIGYHAPAATDATSRGNPS